MGTGRGWLGVGGWVKGVTPWSCGGARTNMGHPIWRATTDFRGWARMQGEGRFNYKCCGVGNKSERMVGWFVCVYRKTKVCVYRKTKACVYRKTKAWVYREDKSLG